MEMMDGWLTVREAAALVRMSEQSLYAAIREKQFPAIHVGRRIRIDPATLREWAKTALAKPEADKPDRR
jgi:excisionase family DNA binding protein